MSFENTIEEQVIMSRDDVTCNQIKAIIDTMINDQELIVIKDGEKFNFVLKEE